jgi:hypothetical protein
MEHERPTFADLREERAGTEERMGRRMRRRREEAPVFTCLYIDFVIQNTDYIHLSTGNSFSITLILSTFSVGCQAQTTQ